MEMSTRWSERVTVYLAGQQSDHRKNKAGLKP